jgi:hypothetical protein
LCQLSSSFRTYNRIRRTWKFGSRKEPRLIILLRKVWEWKKYSCAIKLPCGEANKWIQARRQWIANTRNNETQLG